MKQKASGCPGAHLLWLSYALGTRTLLWFGHGCSGYRMLGTRTLLWFGHGRIIVCSWNTNVIMVWAWMLGLSDFSSLPRRNELGNRSFHLGNRIGNRKGNRE